MLEVPGLRGTLIRADDCEQPQCLPWKRHVKQRPAAVVMADSVDDVAQTVRAAARAGLRVTGQSTGHNAAPLGELSRTVLVRTGGLSEVLIDAETCRARVGAGVRWRDVITPAAQYGLAALSGTSGGVGVVGYTLGGGIGWFTRSHGLATHSLLAVELVTPDGVLRRVDADHEPELFWALRGGGGNFGIVTSLEFRLHRIPDVFAGTLFWPATQAMDVLEAWLQWVPTVPETVTSIARILNVPQAGPFPAHLAGSSFVMVECAIQNPDSTAEAFLAPLRAMGPEMDTFRRMSVAELATVHMDPQDPMPSPGNGMLLRSLDAASLRAFVTVALAESSKILRSIEIRLLGAAARPHPATTAALPGLDAEYSLFALGVAADPGTVTIVDSTIDQLFETVRSKRAPTEYMNFVERTAAPQRLFGSALSRLSEIKRRIDPDDVIHANHPVLTRTS